MGLESKERIMGCMIGGAVGDALGYPIEFLSRNNIIAMYEGKVKDYILNNGIAQVSDDTQMTLFTAMGLLNTDSNDIDVYRENIYQSYMDWYRTQTRKEVVKGHSWLSEVKELYSLRAPGNTCMSSLESGKCGSVKYPINMSKGCGGVMRVAPIGLYGYLKGYSAYDSGLIGAEAAAITHGHFLGIMPSFMLSYMINDILRGTKLVDATYNAMMAMKKEYRHSIFRNKFLRLIESTMEYAIDDLSDDTVIMQLGQGWTGDEALAISIYCALKHQDNFENAVVAAVNHSGDSDSTGAITGNILGTYLGFDAIPQKYKDNLELYNVIVRVAEEIMGVEREEEDKDNAN